MKVVAASQAIDCKMFILKAQSPHFISHNQQSNLLFIKLYDYFINLLFNDYSNGYLF